MLFSSTTSQECTYKWDILNTAMYKQFNSRIFLKSTHKRINYHYYQVGFELSSQTWVGDEQFLFTRALLGTHSDFES